MQGQGQEVLRCAQDDKFNSNGNGYGHNNCYGHLADLLTCRPADWLARLWGWVDVILRITAAVEHRALGTDYGYY
jgi:hypothetical protein